MMWKMGNSFSSAVAAACLAMPNLVQGYVDIPVVPYDDCRAIEDGPLGTLMALMADVEEKMAMVPDFPFTTFNDFAKATQALTLNFFVRQLSPMPLGNSSDGTPVSLNITSPPDEFVGPSGEYTEIARGYHEDVTAFWAQTTEIPAEVIPLRGVHASDLSDLSLEELTLFFQTVLHGNKVNYTQVEPFAQIFNFTVTELYEGGYDSPLVSFNAMFTSGLNNQPQVNWGDGLIEVFTEGDSERFDGLAASIEAHEYGHYIQHILGDLETFPLTTAGSRYKELQADAYGGYYQGHKMGNNLQDDDLCALYDTMASLGDCFFDDLPLPHHGTPDQRKCSMIWAVNVARQDGDIQRTPTEFSNLFDETVASIVALDRTICPLSVACEGSSTASFGTEGEGGTANTTTEAPENSASSSGSTEGETATIEAPDSSSGSLGRGEFLVLSVLVLNLGGYFW